MTDTPTAPRDLARVFKPALLAALLTCLVVPVVTYIEGLTNGAWRGTYLLVATPPVVWEALATRRLFQRRRFDVWGLVLRAISEVATITLAVRLLAVLFRGRAALSDLQAWATNITTFFDFDLLTILGVMAVVWQFTHFLAYALERLEDTRELYDIREAASRFVRDFVIAGGVWLVLVSSLILATPGYFPAYSGGLTGGLQLAVVIYVALGLLLLGYRQYLLYRTRWQSEVLEANGGFDLTRIAQRWLRWGVVLAAVVAVIAAVLPAGYSQGPAGLLQLMTTVFLVVTYLFFFLFTLALTLLAWLIALIARGTGEPLPAPPEFAPPPPAEAGPVPEWWLALRQVLAVTFLLLVISLVLYLYFRDRPLGRWLAETLWAWLVGQWQRFVAWWGRLRGRVRLSINRVRAVRPTDPTVTAPRFSLLRALTPRARIRRYYLLLLARAEQAGLGRARQQTPGEYAHTLTRALPDSASDLNDLTEAYVQARYTAAPIAPTLFEQARRAWSQLQQQLRARRQP